MEPSSTSRTDPGAISCGLRYVPSFRWPSSRAVFHTVRSTRACAAAACRTCTLCWVGPVPYTGIPAAVNMRASAASTCVLPAPAGASITSQRRGEVSTCQAAACCARGQPARLHGARVRRVHRLKQLRVQLRGLRAQQLRGLRAGQARRTFLPCALQELSPRATAAPRWRTGSRPAG